MPSNPSDRTAQHDAKERNRRQHERIRRCGCDENMVDLITSNENDESPDGLCGAALMCGFLLPVGSMGWYRTPSTEHSYEKH